MPSKACHLLSPLDAWGKSGSALASLGLAAMALLATPGARAGTAVRAWGVYYNNLPDYAPMFVPAGITNAVGLASGSNHILALLADGTVAAWGSCYFPWGFVPPMVPAGLTNVVAVSAGEGQSLALRTDGTVVAWNAYDLQPLPTEVTNVVAIAAGGYGGEHNLVLRADGSVVAWGQNSSGQATVPSGLSNVVAVSAGAAHSLALRADGTVVAWGNNAFSQIDVPAGLTNVRGIAAGKVFANLAVRDDGTLVPWGQVYNGGSYVPMSVPAGLSNVVAVSVGNYHAMALQDDGHVVLWGLYHDGTSYLPMSVPPGVDNVEAISSGGNHAAAITGPLAPFLNTPMLNQTAVVGTAPAFRVRVTATRPFFCQWRRDGVDLPGETSLSLVLTNVTLDQAGSYSIAVTNSVGSLVSPAAVLTVVPLAISAQPLDQAGIIGGPAVFSVVCQSVLPVSYQWRFGGVDLAGETNSSLSLVGLAAAQAGNYSVVVSNSAGVVTSSNAILTTMPLVITRHPASQAIVLGDAARFEVDCETFLPLTYQWRRNGIDLPGATDNPLVLADMNWEHKGQYSVRVSNSAGAVVSSNALLRISTRPTTIRSWGLSNAFTAAPEGFTNAAAMSTGPNHTLLLWADGTIAAWGQNDFGQAMVPPGATNILTIAAGEDHSLALREDRTVIAWGRNTYGQATVPAGLNDVIGLAAGGVHSLALREDGSLAAWGANGSGQTNVPPDLTNVVAIAAGTNHSLALRADGTVLAWGDNTYGQTNVPAGLDEVVAIAAGAGHSVALQARGTVVAWGKTYAGRTWIPATAPPELTNVAAIATGLFHTLALQFDGTVAAWGWNGDGQTNIPSGLSNVVALVAGGARSLALVDNGGHGRSVRVTQPTRSDSLFSLEIPTSCGRVYRLEYKVSLLDPNWVALPLVAGTGVPQKLLDPTAGAGSRFYRVREW